MKQNPKYNRLQAEDSFIDALSNPSLATSYSLKSLCYLQLHVIDCNIDFGVEKLIVNAKMDLFRNGETQPKRSKRCAYAL